MSIRDNLRGVHRLWLAFSIILAWFIVGVPSAHAVPSMARQTGYQCAKCHTVFPELTPFGRQFKLGGFAMSSAKWDEKPLAERLPISGALIASRTATRNPTAGDVEADEFPLDRKLIAQTVAGYWGGKFTDNSGALIQYNYDGIEKQWAMEMFDARYANSTSLGGDKELAFGLTLNNNPTTSDIYNSTSAWSFPNTEIAAEQMPAASLIDMTLASKVAGVGIYGMWDDLLYVELANYRTAKTGAFRFVSWGQRWNDEELAGSVVNGNAPYWRVALQREVGPHSFALGTYGMTAKVWQDINERELGSNRFRDIGFDANYQYIQGDHTASARLNWIKEKQTWSDAVVADGLVSNASDTLKTLRATFNYYFRRQVGGTLQYFKTTGSTDEERYEGDALMGSANGSPNSKGWIAEVTYLPVQNLRLALRYTWYQQFNGAGSNYNGFGRNASDNNTLYLMGWFLF